jgi:hypothetical protein
MTSCVIAGNVCFQDVAKSISATEWLGAKPPPSLVESSARIKSTASTFEKLNLRRRSMCGVPNVSRARKAAARPFVK